MLLKVLIKLRPHLAFTCLGLVIILVTSCTGDSSPSDDNVTGTPTATPYPTGTITAGGEIAFITPDGQVALTDPTGASTRVISEFDDASEISWSHDGAMLAAEFGGGGAGVAVMSADGQELFRIADAIDPSWAPTDNRLVASREDDLVIVGSSGEEEHVIERATFPEWSPDGSSLAYLKVNADGAALPSLLDIATGEETGFGSEVDPADPVYPIAWHPAGDVIAYKDALYEPATGETRALPGVPVEWSPDGRLLLQTLETKADGSTTAQLFDFTQGGRPVIGIDVRPSTQDDPPWLEVRRWTAWSPDSVTFLYLDPQPFRVRARVFDTVEFTQDIFRDIEGVDPDISPAGTHAAFSQGQKLWVFALNGTALVNIVDGTKPAWRPQD